jgi:hypothetical protein
MDPAISVKLLIIDSIILLNRIFNTNPTNN